jgi:hypothetical protein
MQSERVINSSKWQEYTRLVSKHVKVLEVALNAHVHNGLGIDVRNEIALHPSRQGLCCFGSHGCKRLGFVR